MGKRRNENEETKHTHSTWTGRQSSITAGSSNNIVQVDGRGVKKRKLHTYEKAKLAYEQIRQEKLQKRKENEQAQTNREVALKRYASEKKAKRRAMHKKTKYGQPKLGQQLKAMLSKIERQTKT